MLPRLVPALRPRGTVATTGALALALLTAPVAAAAPDAAPAAAAAQAPVAVVVQTTGDRAAAAARVRALGGSVGVDLPLVDGFAAALPRDRVAALAAAPGVRAVTPDGPVRLQGNDPTSSEDDADIKPVHRQAVGADQLQALGHTGKGVRVALVDTGVNPVGDLAGRIVPVDDAFQRFPALDGTRRTLDCVDLSGDGDCVDRFGHGTFLASLIAGDGRASGGKYQGVAPEAEIVSLKLAGASGAADVSKVLAALQWVVSFKDRYSIDVVNLSLGSDSRVPVEVDPLNRAVQRAWRSGLVVVVAASNRGPGPETVSKPADDPLVLTVGAVDDRESPGTSDDRVPAYSATGPTAHGRAKPDVVAPGTRLVGARALRSTIEQLAPGGVDRVHRRGSGTSQAAAVTSGLVAQLLQARPDWTPDRVKHALLSTARGVNTTDPRRVGRGMVWGPGALAAPAGADQQDPEPLPDGTLQGSRGSLLVQREGCTEPCTPLTGEQAARDGDLAAPSSFDAGSYTGGTWSGQSWYGSQWVGTSGNSWYGNSWHGQSWYGQSWYGVDGAPQGSAPYGIPLPGSAWWGAWQ